MQSPATINKIYSDNIIGDWQYWEIKYIYIDNVIYILLNIYIYYLNIKYKYVFSIILSKKNNLRFIIY